MNLQRRNSSSVQVPGQRPPSRKVREALEVTAKQEHYPGVHGRQKRAQEQVQATRMLSASSRRKNGEERSEKLEVPS